LTTAAAAAAAAGRCHGSAGVTQPNRTNANALAYALPAHLHGHRDLNNDITPGYSWRPVETREYVGNLEYAWIRVSIVSL